jgi:RHH-type proline utilization regulon transcriptional repressor/proline dehydrogenase/delta 1-pyrroline-5-carboxylate dehydrogenase
VKELRVRVHAEDSVFEIVARVLAARIAGCRTTVSKPPELELPVFEELESATRAWAGDIEFVEETDDQLAEVIKSQHTERIRYATAARVPISIRRAVIDTSIYVADAPILMQGRIELLWYLREQSVCVDYHRYGNLGTRSQEPRAEPL